MSWDVQRHPELAAVGLFVVATAVALAARRWKLPYTIALVCAGLGLGNANLGFASPLTKDVLYGIFLPGLLFEAAFHLGLGAFRRNKWAILSLAVPGVIAAIAVTAAVLVAAMRAAGITALTVMGGVVFGALIAATDPIAVVSLFKTLGVPKRLAELVEGESLLNDGTGVVLFSLVVAFAGGAELGLGGAIVDFVRIAGLGAVVGVGVGVVAVKVSARIDDAAIEITLTTIAAYGSFVIAEHFALSGVIATVVAGMVCGSFSSTPSTSATTRVAVLAFWDYAAFALNSAVFLLIGFQVKLRDLADAIGPILMAYFAVTVGRAAVISVVTLLLRVTRERIPWSWAVILTWGGLRGALSMVLVLTLPSSFPHRGALVTLTYGVVILSILVQGLTMAPLIRALGLSSELERDEVYEALRGGLHAARAALAFLEAMRVHLGPGLHAKLNREYEEKAGAAERALAEHESTRGLHAAEEEASARRRLLHAEKDALAAALHHGTIGKRAYADLVARIDAELVRLDLRIGGRFPGACAPPPSKARASSRCTADYLQVVGAQTISMTPDGAGHCWHDAQMSSGFSFQRN